MVGKDVSEDPEQPVAEGSAGDPRGHPPGPDRHLGAPDVSGILADWRRYRQVDSDGDVRFVINLEVPLSNAALERDLTDALGLEVTVRNLFEPDPELDSHRLLEIPGVQSEDRADLFDMARFIRAATSAHTVDPDIPTPYFPADPLRPREGSAESADWAGWCWADDVKDAPDDPDWAMIRTNVPDAWQRSAAAGRPEAGEGIVIFQPDTGIVPGHGELPLGLELDGRSANYVERNQPQPIDPNQGGGNPGHGTGTASVAVSPVGGRMRGTAPRAQLVPIRCIRAVAVFDQSRVAQAIDHARRNGAHIIAMSLGGVFSRALHVAVRKAVDADIIVLAAAGNCVGTVVWPARYEEAIAVAGINERYEPWRGSSRGEAVDISGPAELVLRASAGDPADPAAVGPGQGTSFAVAHLAGVAACWLAHHSRDALIAALPPGVRLQQAFRSAVRSSATVPPGFRTDRYGAGVVDADALLAQPLAAGGAESAARPSSPPMAHQVADLLEEVGGVGRAEAVGPALADEQSLMELACVGLDMARARRSPRAVLEARPPLSLSRGLKLEIGPELAALALRGGMA